MRHMCSFVPALPAWQKSTEVPGSGNVAITWTGVTMKALCWMPFGIAACLRECIVV